MFLRVGDDPAILAGMGLFDAFKRLFSDAAPAPDPEPMAPAAGTRPDARQLFLEQAIAVAERIDGMGTITREPDQFGLRIDIGGRDHRVFLGNLFAETRELAPEERTARIERLLSAMLTSDEEPGWDEARDQLRPVLRAATFAFSELSELQADDADKAMVRCGALPFLSELLALDRGQSMAYVNHQRLKEWSVAPELAREHAHANLAAIEHAIEPYDAQAGYPIWNVLLADDTFTASFLLRPGWLQSFADKVPGRPVAAIPERATMVVSGDGSPAALARLSELAEREWSASPRAISPALYTVDDAGKVIPLELPRAHELAAKVRLSHLRLAGGEYHHQAEVLNERHERDEVDLYVAAYSIIHRDDLPPVSYCVWGEQSECLLPYTDLVLFVGGEDPDDWHFAVRWSDVAELAGKCWQPAAGLEPPRMHAVHWPDEALLGLFRARAIEIDEA